MANRFTGQIIVIDTTDTQVGGDNPESGQKGPLAILAIKWVNTQNSGADIAANDDLGIKYKDSTGSYVIECRAESGSGGTSVTSLNSVAYSVEFCKPWIVPGLYVEDLDGGELQIFLD